MHDRLHFLFEFCVDSVYVTGGVYNQFLPLILDKYKKPSYVSCFAELPNNYRYT